MGALSSGQRHAVLQAAIEELISAGIDGFSLGRVAKRAGVEPSLILSGWRDRRVLLLDAQLTYVQEAAPLPDTGTLRGDLDALAEAVSRLAATARGRTWVHRLLPADRSNIDLSEARVDFWTIQESNFCEVFTRARRRGELREDIAPSTRPNCSRPPSTTTWCSPIPHSAPNTSPRRWTSSSAA